MFEFLKQVIGTNFFGYFLQIDSPSLSTDTADNRCPRQQMCEPLLTSRGLKAKIPLWSAHVVDTWASSLETSRAINQKEKARGGGYDIWLNHFIFFFSILGH